jgi:Domain of unknown function (DUF4136)
MLLISTLVLLSTMAVAQSVTYDFDKTADFSKFKTYAWGRSTGVNDELNDRRIVSAIDAQMAAKGLVKVAPSEHPDVFVVYHARFETNLEISGFSSGMPYRFGGLRTGTARVEQVAVGDLTVDIIDARTRTIVWRGTAVKDVDAKTSPEKRDKNVNKAVEKLFKNYPPKK